MGIKVKNVTLPRKVLFKKLVEKGIDDFVLLKDFTPGFRNLNEKFPSVFREETVGSMEITFKHNEYIISDFGGSRNRIGMNIIKYLKEITGLSYDRLVIFLLNKYDNKALIKKTKKQKIVPVEKKRRDIKVKVREWRLIDILWWNQFGINLDMLKQAKVFPITHYWVDEYCIYITEEIAYAYYIDGFFKIYRPLADKKDKWRGNLPFNGIQGKTLYKPSPLVFQIKALKDVMTLYSIGFVSLAPPAESLFLPTKTIRWFKNNNVRLITLFDNDTTGIRQAKLCKEQHDVDYIILPSKEKDPSDFVQSNSKQQLFNLILKLI